MAEMPYECKSLRGHQRCPLAGIEDNLDLESKAEMCIGASPIEGTNRGLAKLVRHEALNFAMSRFEPWGPCQISL